MTIGVSGAGRTGGNAAKPWVRAGHEALLSVSRNQPRRLDDAGLAAVDPGGLADAGPVEAPRRPVALYGEEHRPAEAAAAALRAGRPLPATPGCCSAGGRRTPR